MVSSDCSSESSYLFFPSETPTYTTAVPADEVDTLIGSARLVTQLNPTIKSFVNNYTTLFEKVLDRQIQRIKSRSQALEDAHVTVYDKVLLALTNHGADLQNPAAITWYCEEYIGLPLNGSTDEMLVLLEEHHALPLAYHQVKRKQNNRDASIDAKMQRITISEPKAAGTSELTTSSSERSKKKKLNDHDPGFFRLWTIFEDARTQYLRLADHRSPETLTAAKFLRDTAENGVHYLEAQGSKPGRLFTELQNTYLMASQAVIGLSGGRRRKFELNRTGRNGRPSRADRTDHRANHHRQTQRHGRGHSGIPYGYSQNRPVDTYRPL